MLNTLIIASDSVPPNELRVVNVKTKRIILAPGQSLNDLSPRELIMRGIDWEATAKASLVIENVGLPESRQD